MDSDGDGCGDFEGLSRRLDFALEGPEYRWFRVGGLAYILERER